MCFARVPEVIIDPILLIHYMLESLVSSLVATALATGGSHSVKYYRDRVRHQAFSEDLGELGTEFNLALRSNVAEAVSRRDIQHLSNIENQWEVVVRTLDSEADTDFSEEEEMIKAITNAILHAAGGEARARPWIRHELGQAVRTAYQETIRDFEHRIAGTERADLLGFANDRELMDRCDTVINLVEEMKTNLRQEFERTRDRDLRNEGFVRVNSAYFRLHSPHSFDEAWQREFRPIEAHAGYVVDRRKDPDGADIDVTEELVEQLQAGQDTLVLGRGGSGKSAICLAVADRWLDEEIGEVFYRRSNQGRFSDPATLTERLDRATGRPLVVVEDAVRRDTEAIYEVIRQLPDDTEVCFLLDGRDDEYTDFTPGTREVGNRRELKRILTGERIDTYPVPALTPEECSHIVDYYSDFVDTADLTGKELYDRVKNDARAGGMLLLAYHLFDANGLDVDVEDKFESLETPSAEDVQRTGLCAYDADLVRHVGLLVNLLNWAGLDVRREYCFGLAAELECAPSVGKINELLSSELMGWLVFEDDDGRLTGLHEYWSFLYLRYMLKGSRRADGDRRTPPITPGEAHTRFATCVNAMLAVLEGEVEADEIKLHAPDNKVLANITSDPEDEAKRLLTEIYRPGKRHPIFAPLFEANDVCRIKLAESPVCSDATVARVLLEHGSIYRERGEFESAEAKYKESNGYVASTNEDRQTELEARHNIELGGTLRTRGEFDRAEEVLQNSLEKFRSIDDQEGEGRSLSNLGGVFEVRGELEAAEEKYRESLAIDREIGDRPSEATSLSNLGGVFEARGELEAAEEKYRESLAIDREIGDRRREATSLNNLGEIARQREELEAAEEKYRESLAIVREIGDRRGEARSLNNLGVVLHTRGELEAAEEEFKEAVKISTNINYLSLTLNAIAYIVDLCESSDATEEAIDWCDRAIEIAEEADDQEVLERFQNRRSKLTGE
jgi:tetratricopeptide (TPR) repeat protein